MEYRPHGVCSQLIRVELDGDIVKNVEFVGGCNGNTKGICSLIRGMNVHDVISRLEGITCGYKSTSCPDQLAYALKKSTNRHRCTGNLRLPISGTMKKDTRPSI